MSHEPPQVTTEPNALCAPPAAGPQVRPRVKGKFVYVGGDKVYVRGVTYGPFRPNEDGCEYLSVEVVERDFAQMAANGINAVRTYTVPPRWFLDAAQKHNLWVMIGLPWEQHIAFLDDTKRTRAIEERVRAGVRECAGHPAVFGYAIGNEIPAQIVRWHGHRRVERFLHRLYRAAKAEDPDALVTYVNYPTTEYLQLPFIDFACFNVYLETQQGFEAYLARLQNLVGNRPLVMAEIGLDSQRHGENAQATTLEWQVRTAFAAGCAGAFVFAWTDEWHRSGYDIDDWNFGLTDRNRRPKPALTAVRNAFAELPFPRRLPWPKVSVVVCTHNGGRTVQECCEALRELRYPDFEVIIVDDGSADASAAIAGKYGFQLIRTEHRGLSHARNVGLDAASGDIVAYIDDDAYPDPDWLTHLAHTFLETNHAGVGGPNISAPGDGPIADCVANTPGNPVHVLLSDREAEHIAGCNMAYRKAALEAIGGFDPQFRIAGDDVDLCWRLQRNGGTLGFNPAATVWHHRRSSIKAFLKQQVNYGKAEALLELKWPEKYSPTGCLLWQGRLYGSFPTSMFRRWRIYHGVWGSGLFQSMYEPAPHALSSSLLLMPEWFLVVAGLAGVCLLGTVWTPFLWALPLLALAIAAPVARAVFGAAQASFSTETRSRLERWKLYGLTAALHLLQPIARLSGRIFHGLTPWRRRGISRLAFPRPRKVTIWSENWQAPEKRVAALEARLRDLGAVVLRGGAFDRWELEIRGGLFGAVRTRIAIEEHGGGKQRMRLRAWPRFTLLAPLLTLLFALLSGVAAWDRAWLASAIFGGMSVLLVMRMFGDCAAATATYLQALHQAVREKD